MANNKSQTVNITVPRELLKQVDAMAKRDFTTRSDMIRQALLEKIRRPALDEWGDPLSENWQTLIDFRKEGYPNGIPADEFIDSLKKLEQHD